MILRNLRTLWRSEWALDDKLHFGKLQSVEKVKELHFAWACRKSPHQLQDAVCQQVRALIDLRLPNCALIKEQSCSVPFFLLIWTFYLFGFGMDTAGLNVFSACWECLVCLCEFIFLPTLPFHVLARSERWLNSRESATAVCHREAQHHTDRWEGEGR